MPAFDTFFDDTAFPALTDTFFGSAGSYQAVAGGDPVSCQVVITRDVVIQPIGYDATAVITGDVLEALVADVGDVSEGDTFTVATVVYTCKKELENNSKITKWVVHD
jgi:hypothetical protein